MDTYTGKSIFNGIAIGRILFYKKGEQAVTRVKVQDTSAEVERYERAKQTALKQLGELHEKAVEEAKRDAGKILEKLPFGKLNLEGFDGEHLMEKFNRPEWAELSEACLGCGTCTFVCPTCQCYYVRDFDKGNGVQRYRCWDSCMYSDFTMMAHGTNRPTQKERFRQRFMHKLVYFPSNNDGIYGCVGCGRCLQKCPIHMNIVKVANTLGEGTK